LVGRLVQPGKVHFSGPITGPLRHGAHR
jgi:hypothetical protein